VAVSAGLISDEDVTKHFENFKVKYDRTYKDQSEEMIRKQIFSENLEKIARNLLDFEAGLKSYKMGVNQFADRTNLEYNMERNALKMPTKQYPHLTYRPDKRAVPDSVDWRTNTNPAVVTPIKDQGQCGSCWAFSAVASLEGQHALNTKTLVSLSEQNLVDCSQAEGNEGCNGGLMDYAFQYIIDAGGIDTEDSYPYKAEDDPCTFNKKNVGATVKNFTDVTSGDENALKTAVATIGPISVGIDASADSFQLYKSGVYDEPACSSSQLDHGVTAVGYGKDDQGVEYWIVKNSWGTSWGLEGYILMSRDKNNQCGIATAASFPNVS